MILPALAFAWLLGPICYGVFGLPWWFAGAFLAAILPQVALRFGRQAAIVAGVGVFFALVAGWRFDGWAGRPEPAWASFTGSEVTIEGRVDSEPDYGTTTTAYVVVVDRVLLGDADLGAGGRVRAALPQYTDLHRGAVVRFTGELADLEADGAVGYRDYLRREGISGTVPFAGDLEVLGTGSRSFAGEVSRVRLELERGLQRVLPEPQASLAAGIGFGRDQGLTRQTEEEFRRSGLAHLIAVSGSNVALIAAGIYLISLRFMGRRASAAVVGAMVAAYAILAGADWPILRATGMAYVLLLGWFVGRPQVGLAGLAVAIVLLTSASPGAFASASFQLSVVATAGILMLGDWARWVANLPRRIPAVRAVYPRRMADVLGITTAANIAVLPLAIALFGQVSIVGLATNVVAEPLFTAALPIALITAFAAVAVEPAGSFIGLFAYYPLGALTGLAAWSAGLPYAYASFDPLPAQVTAVAYACILTLAFFAYLGLPPRLEAPARDHRAERSLRRTAYAAGFAALGVAVYLVSLAPLVRPGGDLVVTMLDVGQGDAILIRTPGGQHLLVDGGPSGTVLAAELGEVLPHWQRSLSAVFLTHPDSDHSGGLPDALRRYNAAAVYETGQQSPASIYTAFVTRADDTRVLFSGRALEIDGVRLDVLWPPPGHSLDANESSLVLRVTFGDVSFLLTGDIEGDAQAYLAEQDIAADVLKVPHHGSRTNDIAFLSAVNPVLALISAGEGNRYGHPAQETLDALTGIPIARTDLDGRVTVHTDGQTISVETSR